MLKIKSVPPPRFFFKNIVVKNFSSRSIWFWGSIKSSTASHFRRNNRKPWKEFEKNYRRGRIRVKSFFCVELLLRPSLPCICEILCMSTRWVRFSVSTVHELSSREEKNSWLSRDANPWLLGGKQECHLCATEPPPPLQVQNYLFSFKKMLCHTGEVK